MTTDTQGAAIDARGLVKLFRDFWMRVRVRAIDGLDLRVDRGEIFGLLGPNGSGKSTTIKILLGLLFPTRGVVRVLGQRPGELRANASIGFLPEESHLYPFLNARETLDYYGRLFGLDRSSRRERTDRLLELVGLDAVQERAVGEYSKGMQRRIGLAQALINDPELLILDEPTSGLDPIGTRQVKDLILDLKRRGKTVLLTSHLLSDVEDVCDRIAILYGGKKRAEGTCSELLTKGNTTRIELSTTNQSTVDALVKLLREREGDAAVLTVEIPRQKLETLFLDIVRDARCRERASPVSDTVGVGIDDSPGDRDDTPIVNAQQSPESRGASQGLSDSQSENQREARLGRSTPLAEESAAETLVPAEPVPDESIAKDSTVKELPPAITDVDRALIDSLLSKGSREEES